MQEVELTWSEKLIEKGLEKGLEEGLEKGREEGIVEGKRKTLLRLLASKFGAVPEQTKARAAAMSEVELDSVLDRILSATTLEDLPF